MDQLRVESIGTIENGRIIHRDLCAEVPITEIGPIAHLAVPDADDVSQAVASHIGEKDRLHRVLKADSSPDSSISWLGGPASGIETVASRRWIPGEYRVVPDQDIGHAIAVEIEEPGVWVVQIDTRKRL